MSDTTKLTDITFEQFAAFEFTLYDGNPVLRHFGGSFTAADPTLLTPDLTPDGKWRMFCHTFFGVYCMDSDDGISFGSPVRIVKRAMRPNVNFIDGKYILYYERTLPLIGNALSLVGGKWRSEIYATVSDDLKNWSVPFPVITKSRPFEVCKLGQSISNPFLIKTASGYRLYYSCGLTYIKDCGFSEPTYVSYAESDSPTDGFVSRERPIISPDKNSDYLNLCSGCLKVYRLKDCYIGLQNGIFSRKGKSHSAIMLLRSDDGDRFDFIKPLIEPQTLGSNKWMAQYVYACHLSCYKDELRIYFNARNTSNALSGRENIGFASCAIKRCI